MEPQTDEYRQLLEGMLIQPTPRFLQLIGLIVSPEEAGLLLAMPGQPIAIS